VKNGLAFAIVDVFADAPLQGNPLAVVANGDALPVEVMHRIAAEFGFSETTFIVQPRDESATWRLRSFTATGAEVVGAGHNALGAWWWLAHSGRLALTDGVNGFAQELGERVLPLRITVEYNSPRRVTMEQSAPIFDAIPADRRSLAEGLGLDEDELQLDLPAQTVSTGVPHLLVPAASRAAVDRAVPDASSLREILKAHGAQGCYLFSCDPHTVQHDAYARFFNPTAGIKEDPATGSAAGPLAAYLRKNRSAGADVVIEQGYAMGRPSTLHVRVDGDRVEIAGAAVVIAEGRLSV
jgi:trans-2,3-dihydro-3-hydroxyanthranilate isomerase